MSTRSLFYLLARLIGDFEAARKGPRAIVTRLARKSVLRTVGKATDKIR